MSKSWKQIAAEAAVVLAALLTALWLYGCAYKGGKITEGTDFSAGINLPATEGAAEISFVNYLSGFRLGIDRNCGMDCEFWGTNSFTFAWGLYGSEASKHFKAKVDPCETAPTAREPETDGEPPPDAGGGLRRAEPANQDREAAIQDSAPGDAGAPREEDEEAK